MTELEYWTLQIQKGRISRRAKLVSPQGGWAAKINAVNVVAAVHALPTSAVAELVAITRPNTHGMIRIRAC